MVVPILLWSLFLMTHHDTSGEGWSIQFDTEQSGPRFVVNGEAYLHFDEETEQTCINYCFDVPEGVLSGPIISGHPGDAVLPFDLVRHGNGQVEIEWCEKPSDMQTLPVSVPRGFSFYIVRQTYGPDDLLELLAQWGQADSVWDLNNDGTVDGKDLALVIGNWENDNDEGSP